MVGWSGRADVESSDTVPYSFYESTRRAARRLRRLVRKCGRRRHGSPRQSGVNGCHSLQCGFIRSRTDVKCPLPHYIGESFIAFTELSCSFLKEVHAGDTLYPALEIVNLEREGGRKAW
jgi:hypothetical protein